MNFRIGATLFAMLLGAAAHAQTVADFYRTNNLKMIIAASAGEGYDTAGRLVARHLGKHIPGSPRIIVENMGGAAGRLGANHIFNVAPHDGSVIGEILQTFALGQAIEESGIRYDARKFTFVGSAITPTDVFVARRSAGVFSMADARTKEITIGSTSVTSQNFIYPTLANQLLGARFKIVTGYHGASDINLALARGEVQGRGAFPWAQMKAEHDDWIKSNFLVYLAQTGLIHDPELPDVPTLVDLATDAEARGVFEFLSLTSEIGRPLVAPPGVPDDRANALRDAFEATMRDAEFLADGARLMEEIIPKNAITLAGLVKRAVEFDPRIVARFKAILAGLKD